jgi:hypothetical protein
MRSPRFLPLPLRCFVDLGVAGAIPLTAMGCVATDPTEMVVLVDTDLPIGSQDGSPVLPGAIRTIRFEVACIAETGDPPCRLRGRDETTFSGFQQSYAEANLGTRPPFYFVLRRDAPGLRRTIRVTATATLGPEGGDDETVVATASAATVEGDVRVMVVGLRRECVNVTCPADMTCTLGGGCAPPSTPAVAWTGSCETVPRPGFPSRACVDDLFAP